MALQGHYECYDCCSQLSEMWLKIGRLGKDWQGLEGSCDWQGLEGLEGLARIGKDWQDWQARQTTPDTLQTPSRHLSDNLQTTTKTPATITDKDGKSETMPDSLADWLKEKRYSGHPIPPWAWQIENWLKFDLILLRRRGGGGRQKIRLCPRGI